MVFSNLILSVGCYCNTLWLCDADDTGVRGVNKLMMIIIIIITVNVFVYRCWLMSAWYPVVSSTYIPFTNDLNRSSLINLLASSSHCQGQICTNVLGPGKRACKIASGSLWPGFASANQLSVWLCLTTITYSWSFSFLQFCYFERSRAKLAFMTFTSWIDQITRNQGNTCHSRGHHNQVSRICQHDWLVIDSVNNMNWQVGRAKLLPVMKSLALMNNK